jgi:hypothetical protein
LLTVCTNMVLRQFPPADMLNQSARSDLAIVVVVAKPMPAKGFVTGRC